jgi:lipoate-protein ligase B
VRRPKTGPALENEMIETRDSCQTHRKAYAIKYLGIVPYEDALLKQEALRLLRAEAKISDTVLLLQHRHIYTTGRFRGEEDIIAPPEDIPIILTNRGGSITYHGPGQLVGYPIIDLKANGMSVRQYIWNLEEVIIHLLWGFGIEAQRHTDHPGGVWARGHKICSIGINISRHITTHGFALNVNNDLRYFEYIRPCGLRGAAMTSMAELLGHGVPFATVVQNWIKLFAEVFDLRPGKNILLPAEEVALD